jgi:hypothetical protein
VASDNIIHEPVVLEQLIAKRKRFRFGGWPVLQRFRNESVLRRDSECQQRGIFTF